MFQRLIKGCVKLVQRYLPEPFIFAILITIVAFICAMPICHQSPLDVLSNWGGGVWHLLEFAMQMTLVLVCGSVLADSDLIKKWLRSIASVPKTPFQAIAIVTLVSTIACWINWGFGLIVGVIFAKQIAMVVKGVDYRLLIASAYSGFVVWHSGLSASIPLAMATEGEALVKTTAGSIQHAIPISESVFSLYNMAIVITILVVMTLVNALMHPKGKDVVTIDPALLAEEAKPKMLETDIPTPAQKLERSKILTWLTALMGLGFLVLRIGFQGGSFDLNMTIMLFLFLGILLHKTPIAYVRSLTKSSSAAAGIILQFPFYAGIMGILTGTAGGDGASLAGKLSDACVAISNEQTFPLLSFLSAAILNMFVPSGGGHWVVQAPILIPAGIELGVAPSVTGMSIAWGDAWTNLIQPFWAIPALAIAKLGARDIMGFCLIDLFVTGIIIMLGLLFLV